MTNQSQNYASFSNELAMRLYEVNALISAVETMAENHENGESDPVLVNIALLTRLAGNMLNSTSDSLDSSSLKYTAL